jgi:hypothetical protein
MTKMELVFMAIVFVLNTCSMFNQKLNKGIRGLKVFSSLGGIIQLSVFIVQFRRILFPKSSQSLVREHSLSNDVTLTEDTM